MATNEAPAHRARVDRLIGGSATVLSEWEREFLRSIAGRDWLTDKQSAKLNTIEARANAEPVDPMVAFLDAMEAAGIVPDEPISDRLGPDKIRFRCVGDRKGRRNGWAKFYDDGMPAGSFGSYKLQLAQCWRLENPTVLTDAEREEIDRQARETKARREAEQRSQQDTAACICDAMWQRARAVDPSHGYLVRKGIPGEGLRQLDNMLLVPMRDEGGGLWNLQRIWPNGEKLYIKNARAHGLFTVIGQPSDRLVVAEGYATGAVIRRATGWPIAIAFCWENLKRTAQAMRGFYPSADIVIAADDDTHLIDNPKVGRNLGLEAAREAAAEIGGRLAMPPRMAA